MDGLDPLEEEDTDTVFRDVIFLALAGFVAVVILLLPHLNPPAQAQDEAPSPGNVIVELRWPDQINADVDLWVEAPGDVPVGYSNKGGRIFNLLRDDLGKQADTTELNYEVTYSRGVPAGDYTVNVHLYRDLQKEGAIPVAVVVSVKQAPDLPAKQIVARKLELHHEGQELTVMRFSLDKSGRLVKGSVHDLPKALRAKKT